MTDREFLIGMAFLVAGLGTEGIARAQEEESLSGLKKAMEAKQKEYEERLGALELYIELLEEGKTGEETRQERLPREEGQQAHVPAQGVGVSPGRIGELGQTDRFSRTFNPAIGLVLATLVTGSTDRDSLEGQDRFWLRTAELSLAAQIDPFGYAYAMFEGMEGEGVHVIEAAGVLNRLPANFSVKGGRMLADITKLGQRHDHELPFVEKPGVLTNYIGGSLQGAGLEVHQWFGLSDTVPLRWSVGMFTDLEGHTHAIGQEHHHHDPIDSDAKRHLDNFQYGGRLTTYLDLDDERGIQFGTSVWWAPDILIEEAIGRFTSVAGFMAAFMLDWPLGPTNVVTAFLVMALIRAGKAVFPLLRPG